MACYISTIRCDNICRFQKTRKQKTGISAGLVSNSIIGQNALLIPQLDLFFLIAKTLVEHAAEDIFYCVLFVSQVCAPSLMSKSFNQIGDLQIEFIEFRGLDPVAAVRCLQASEYNNCELADRTVEDRAADILIEVSAI